MKVPNIHSLSLTTALSNFRDSKVQNWSVPSTQWVKPFLSSDIRAANILQIICHQRKNENNSSRHLTTTLGAHCSVPSFTLSSDRFFVVSPITLTILQTGKGILENLNLVAQNYIANLGVRIQNLGLSGSRACPLNHYPLLSLQWWLVSSHNF